LIDAIKTKTAAMSAEGQGKAPVTYRGILELNRKEKD